MKNKNKKFDKTIGLHLKYLREENGMSPMELHKASGVNRGSIFKYESGFHSISIYNLYRLLGAMDLSLTYFFDELDNKI